MRQQLRREPIRKYRLASRPDDVEKPLDHAPVAVSEEPQVHERRPELIHRAPDLVLLVETAIALEERGRRASEERQHGKVHLCMAIGAGRIDQPGKPVWPEENISRPEIAMKKRWGRGLGQEIRHPPRQRLEPPGKCARQPIRP